MSVYTFCCPYCGARLTVPVEAAATEGVCSGCGRPVVAPSPEVARQREAPGDQAPVAIPLKPFPQAPAPWPAPRRPGRWRWIGLAAGALVVAAAIAWGVAVLPRLLAKGPVAGLKEVAVEDARENGKELSRVKAGTRLTVLATESRSLRVRAPNGAEGWVERCELCSAEEYARRTKEGLIPIGGLRGRTNEKGDVVWTGLTGGASLGATVGEGGVSVNDLDPEHAVWTEVEGDTLTLGSRTFTGNPQVLYLITKRGSVEQLPIWTEGMP